MTNEQAKAEIMQIYGVLSPSKQQALDVAIKALEQEPISGHWIELGGTSAICSCCHKHNLFYGDFCKWCGAKIEAQEREDNI